MRGLIAINMNYGSWLIANMKYLLCSDLDLPADAMFLRGNVGVGMALVWWIAR
jgi:hypothetical protein